MGTVSAGRRLLAVVAGLIAAVAVIFLLEAAGHALYVPVGTSPGSASIDQMVIAAPIGAKLLVVLGWFAGSAIGGALALRLSGWRASVPVVAGLLAVAGIVNVIQIPHPLWMSIAAVVAPLLGIPAALAVARWSAQRSRERL